MVRYELGDVERFVEAKRWAGTFAASSRRDPRAARCCARASRATARRASPNHTALCQPGRA